MNDLNAVFSKVEAHRLAFNLSVEEAVKALQALMVPAPLAAAGPAAQPATDAKAPVEAKPEVHESADSAPTAAAAFLSSLDRAAAPSQKEPEAVVLIPPAPLFTDVPVVAVEPHATGASSQPAVDPRGAFVHPMLHVLNQEAK